MPRRILLLDDDPTRALKFQSNHPGATWVETADACIEALHQSWDEVHLDHDLGGEHYVDHDRDDCGMAVVRWLCVELRPHLKSTLFIIHTHNQGAAVAMTFQLQSTGYTVEERRFGSGQSPSRTPARQLTWIARLGRYLGRILSH